MFVADAPDTLWCTDITEHPTREGKVYCCAALDVFSRRIVEAELLGSMGRVASSVDTTMMESLSTMQRELLDRQRRTTRAQLASSICELIEAFYNPVRRRTSIGMLSPAQYEHLYNHAASAA